MWLKGGPFKGGGAILCYFVLFCAILCYFVLFCAILCYFVLFWSTPFIFTYPTYSLPQGMNLSLNDGCRKSGHTECYQLPRTSFMCEETVFFLKLKKGQFNLLAVPTPPWSSTVIWVCNIFRSSPLFVRLAKRTAFSQGCDVPYLDVCRKTLQHNKLS